MKTLYLISSLLLLSCSLCAQDWPIVNSGYVYHYVEHYPDGTESDSLKAQSIYIDSIRGDTSYLNRVIRYDGNVPSIGGFAPYSTQSLHNQTQFLQEYLRVLPDGSTQFRGIDPFEIKQLGYPTPWPFDSLNSVIAEKDSLYEGNTYGELDSLRLILLSSGDSLIMSKKFGILRFPMEYGTNTYYRQIGIGGANKGFTFPNLEDVFTFSVGDKFEYHRVNYYKPGGMLYNYTLKKAITIHQVEILEARPVPGGMQYKTKNNYLTVGGSCNVNDIRYSEPSGCYLLRDVFNLKNYAVFSIEDQRMGIIQEETVLFSWDQIPYDLLGNVSNPPFPQHSIERKPDLYMKNALPNELVWTFKSKSEEEGSIFGVATPFYTSSSSEKVKGNLYFRRCLQVRHIPPRLLPSFPLKEIPYFISDYTSCRISGVETNEIRLSWAKGLGFTYVFWGHNIYTHSSYDVQTSLNAYKTASSQKGFFTDPSFFTEDLLSLPSNPLIRLHPNPSNDFVILNHTRHSGEIQLTLYDLTGREIYRSLVIEEGSIRFDLSTVQPGLYWAKVQDLLYKQQGWTRLLITD